MNADQPKQDIDHVGIVFKTEQSPADQDHRQGVNRVPAVGNSLFDPEAFKQQKDKVIKTP